MFHSLGQRPVRRRTREIDPRIDSERTAKPRVDVAHFDVPKEDWAQRRRTRASR
jgi:hypothetical protein